MLTPPGSQSAAHTDQIWFCWNPSVVLHYLQNKVLPPQCGPSQNLYNWTQAISLVMLHTCLPWISMSQFSFYTTFSFLPNMSMGSHCFLVWESPTNFPGVNMPRRYPLCEDFPKFLRQSLSFPLLGFHSTCTCLWFSAGYYIHFLVWFSHSPLHHWDPAHNRYSTNLCYNNIQVRGEEEKS